ncbi:MAG TPA: O-antigen ligase family protein [Gaiellaceae bacterium]|nr:O-antigen ligase family protein [Gaiellaceae bacterium]
MERVELAEAAAVLGALAAPLLLLARNRLVLLAGVALLAGAQTGLALALVPDQVRDLVGSPARFAAAALVVVAVAALAVAFARWPAAMPVALLAVAPIRVHVELGDEEAFLLLPLYGVLAAAALGLLLRLVRGVELRPLPLVVAVPAAAFVAIAGFSLLWSSDPREGTIDLFFFYFPFAMLFAVVAQTLIANVLSRMLVALLLAQTAVLAGIGLWQEWTHTLFFADDLQFANAYTSYFRVTSIFDDSSIYGRHLVLGIAVLVTLLWLDRLRPAVALPLLGFALAGLYFSYSQSSFVALFAAVMVVGLVAGDRGSRRALAATAGALVLVAGGLLAYVAHDESARRVTSGRLPLVSLTFPVFRDHPVVGVGLGGQARASSRLEDARERKRRNVSHTTPLTVAAELGLLGLAAYAAFLLGAVRGAVLAMRRTRALGLSLLAAFTALVVHSLFYSGFFEDPLTWGVLGLTAACLSLQAAHAFQPEPGPKPEPEGQDARSGGSAPRSREDHGPASAEAR